MLILNRNPRESIRVGNEIIITLLKSFDVQVTISIKAPRGIPIRKCKYTNAFRKITSREAFTQNSALPVP